MEYVKLGNSGLDVSRLCLGCMGFGEKGRWIHPWVIDEEGSRSVIKKALDLGINFFDTANDTVSFVHKSQLLGCYRKNR